MTFRSMLKQNCVECLIVTIQWNVYFRDVTTEWLKQNPIKLGGKGVICQIGHFIMLFWLFLSRKKVFAAAEDAGHVIV